MLKKLLFLLCSDIQNDLRELDKRRAISRLYIEHLSEFPEVVLVLENMEKEAAIEHIKAPLPFWSILKLKSMLVHRRLKYAYCTYCPGSRQLGSLTQPHMKEANAHTLRCPCP